MIDFEVCQCSTSSSLDIVWYDRIGFCECAIHLAAKRVKKNESKLKEFDSFLNLYQHIYQSNSTVQ